MDAIVAGAGIWGCTVARRLAEAGRQVLVLEKRAAVGGNVRCHIDDATGIEIHDYGCHIFHTRNRTVWNFVRRFTDFNGYQHHVFVNYQGRIYQLPIGLLLINKFFDVELTPMQVSEFLTPERKRHLFDAFFRGYTSKQWGLSPESVDPSIIERIPVRDNFDTNYYKDYWEGIPCDGYNEFFCRLLDHPNIRVETGRSFSLSEEMDVRGLPVYYSGPIDALFDYKFGALPWRSLQFEFERLPVRDYQGTSQMNYTEVSVPWTRIVEFKHFHPEGKLMAQGKDWGFNAPETVIMREFPRKWERGDEPYYPIQSAESSALLGRYQAEVAFYNQQSPSLRSYTLIVGGRLGGYRYYDMDQAMSAALAQELV